MRKVVLSKSAGKDFVKIKEIDKSLLTKILTLIEDIQQHPFTGLGKPEPLVGNYSGYWSRRITKEHRLVYKVDNDFITIIQCKYHY